MESLAAFRPRSGGVLLPWQPLDTVIWCLLRQVTDWLIDRLIVWLIDWLNVRYGKLSTEYIMMTGLDSMTVMDWLTVWQNSQHIWRCSYVTDWLSDLAGKLVGSGAIVTGVMVLALPITIIVNNFMQVTAFVDYKISLQLCTYSMYSMYL